MKNTIKKFRIAAFVVLLLGFSMQVHAQKTITVTDIPNSYRGKIGFLALSPANSSNYTAYSMVAINGAQVRFPLSDWTTDKPWNGNGNFTFAFVIYDNAEAAKNEKYTFSGVTVGTTGVNSTNTQVLWSQFLKSAGKGVSQKSITVTGIPGNYSGKFGFLALSPAANNSNYTAYSMGTLNGASATFPLYNFVGDEPWDGTGNFFFTLLIADDAQAVAKKQYIFMGQTAATTNVRQASTTVQWAQFGSAASQTEAKQPEPQKAEPPQPATRQTDNQRRQPAAREPATPISNTYIISGSDPSFSATRDGTTVGTGTMEAIIAAIKTNANGADITVQFGNGTNVLDIGKGNNNPLTGTVIFNGTGWGTVTVTGKVTANRAGYPNGSTVEFDGVTGIINADITNTNSNWHAITKKGKIGTLTVNGGTITGGSNGIGATDTSEVIVNGGTITGSIGINLGLDARATVNGGRVVGTSSAGVWLTNNSNMLTVNGGTIQGTGNANGIYCGQGGTVILSGSNTVVTSSAVPGSKNDRATIALSNGGEKGYPSQRATLVIGKGVTITNTVPTGQLIFNRTTPAGQATVTDNR